jgi:hypothetical protein
MHRAFATFALLALLAAACNTPAAPSTTTVTTDDSTYINSVINGTSDCEDLQALFDGYAEAHDRFAASDRADKLEQMSLFTGRMDAADQRMREVGCY